MKPKPKALYCQLSHGLIQRFVHGDVEAFREIYHSFFNQVFHFANRLSLSAEDAEEITQDVFLKLWEKRQTLNIGVNINGFIYTIAQNMVIDKFRQYTARENRLKQIIDINRTKIVNSNSTENLINYYELSEIITQLVQELPNRRRTVFKLNREKGFTYKEIADLLQISQGTVEKQISKSLESIKSKLKAKYGIRIDL